MLHTEEDVEHVDWRALPRAGMGPQALRRLTSAAPGPSPRRGTTAAHHCSRRPRSLELLVGQVGKHGFCL